MARANLLLIRTIVGMQAPIVGMVWLGKDNVHKLTPKELATRLSVVLTDRIEAINLSTYELVALGRYPYTNWSGHLTRQDEKAVEWALEATRSDELASRLVAELSDGERQRVMIARALAQEPQIMVLDEPTAFLDLPRRMEIINLLRNLAHETGRTFLVATHDLDIALRVADRIWLLSMNGPLRTGTPEELVLNGSFESVFQNKDIMFDNISGSFKFHKNYHHQVGLIGNGLTALWTAHAFEREGFEVINDNNCLPLQVKILIQGNTTYWQVIINDSEFILESLSAAINVVREYK